MNELIKKIFAVFFITVFASVGLVTLVDKLYFGTGILGDVVIVLFIASGIVLITDNIFKRWKHEF